MIGIRRKMVTANSTYITPAIKVHWILILPLLFVQVPVNTENIMHFSIYNKEGSLIKAYKF